MLAVIKHTAVGLLVVFSGAGAFAAAMEPVTLDLGFPGAWPATIEQRAEDHFVLTPKTFYPGGQFFYASVRIKALPSGHRLALDFVWPPTVKYDPAAGPRPTGDAARVYMGSFVLALPTVIFQSDDLRTWAAVPDVVKVDQDTVRVHLVGTGKPFYIATQIPYHPDLHRELIELVREREPGALRVIGHSPGGRPLQIITLEATRRDVKPPTVYIQAYQHITEFTGPLVVDAMVRYLLDTPAGRKARERLSWHILPVFEMDALATCTERLVGPGKASNPNRDWVDQTWPEVRAVAAFIQAEKRAGRAYVVGIDLHNGWGGRLSSSAACYTIFASGRAEPALIARQREFIDFMCARTDHEVPKYWAHDVPGTFAKFFHGATGAPAHTIEFSRFIWWNRARQEYEPYRPHHPPQFARQFVEAMAEYWVHPVPSP